MIFREYILNFPKIVFEFKIKMKTTLIIMMFFVLNGQAMSNKKEEYNKLVMEGTKLDIKQKELLGYMDIYGHLSTEEGIKKCNSYVKEWLIVTSRLLKILKQKNNMERATFNFHKDRDHFSKKEKRDMEIILLKAESGYRQGLVALKEAKKGAYVDHVFCKKGLEKRPVKKKKIKKHSGKLSI